MKHLRRVPQHGAKATECKALWKAATKIIRTNSSSRRRGVRENWKGASGTGVKAPIPGLPIVNVKECIECGTLFKTWSGWYKHMVVNHAGSPRSRKTWRELPMLKAQSFTRKRGFENLFLVKQVSESNRGELGSDISILDYDAGKIDGNNHEGQHTDREKSGFLRVTRVDERLKSFGLNLEEAMGLRVYPNRDKEPLLYGMAKDLRKATEGILVDAQEWYHKYDMF